MEESECMDAQPPLAAMKLSEGSFEAIFLLHKHFHFHEDIVAYAHFEVFFKKYVIKEEEYKFNI